MVMQYREYGNTGIELSVIGFGGIVLTDTEPEHAVRIVAEAVGRGVNYFDVAPSYGDAQDRLGPALKPYRNDVFLACKTGQRDREGAEAELQDSAPSHKLPHRLRPLRAPPRLRAAAARKNRWNASGRRGAWSSSAE